MGANLKSSVLRWSQHLQVSDGFDDVRKKRLNELAQQRTSSSVPVIAVPETASRSVIPPKSPSKPATRVSPLSQSLKSQ